MNDEENVLNALISVIITAYILVLLNTRCANVCQTDSACTTDCCVRICLFLKMGEPSMLTWLNVKERNNPGYWQEVKEVALL